MKNKSKFIIIISIFVILIGLLSTFAYFTWKSTNNDISFTVSGVTVELNDGKDITGANLMPTLKYTSTGNINKPIKIRLKEETPDTVTVNINLKINTIDTGLKDSSFKYTLVSGNTIIKEGNFSSATNNSTITLATLTNTSTTNKLTTTTSTYNLYIWIDGTMDNPSTMMNKSFDFSLDITGSNSSKDVLTSTLATDVVEALDDQSTGDSGSGVYRVQHDAIASSNSATGSTIQASTDYRYYGPSPNNYICLDMEGKSTCPDKHLYRIIGSIYEELEGANRLKVIKATPLTDGTTNEFSWDYTSSGSYNNIWATVTSGNYSNSLTSGSELMKLLNSGAWWNGTSGSYYNNSTTATTVNFTNYKLSDKAKSYITTSRYYLGGYNTSKGVMTNQYYAYERGTTRYDTNRPLYWDGYVGLMYPSDYGYATGNSCATGTNLYDYNVSCKSKDWLYISNTGQWLMSTDSGHSDRLPGVFIDGRVINGVMSSSDFEISPVFYLSSSASITDGEGTSVAPYILS